MRVPVAWLFVVVLPRKLIVSFMSNCQIYTQTLSAIRRFIQYLHANVIRFDWCSADWKKKLAIKSIIYSGAAIELLSNKIRLYRIQLILCVCVRLLSFPSCLLLWLLIYLLTYWISPQNKPHFFLLPNSFHVLVVWGWLFCDFWPITKFADCIPGQITTVIMTTRDSTNRTNRHECWLGDCRSFSQQTTVFHQT